MTEGTTTGSTVPRRQLGRYLRNQSRLTVRAAATQLEWSEAKIWRIETGQTSLRSFGPALSFTAAEWAAFTTGVCAGEFD